MECSAGARPLPGRAYRRRQAGRAARLRRGASMAGADVTPDHMEEFLAGLRRPPPPTRVLSTVLFTDIAASTEQAGRLGDRRWRELLEVHDEAARRVVEEFGGRLVATAGSGEILTSRMVRVPSPDRCCPTVACRTSRRLSVVAGRGGGRQGAGRPGRLAAPAVMAVRVAVHQPVPDKALAGWLDSTPDLSSTNGTQAHSVDVDHQPTDLAVGGSNPSRRAPNAAGQRPGVLALLVQRPAVRRLEATARQLREPTPSAVAYVQPTRHPWVKPDRRRRAEAWRWRPHPGSAASSRG
jgi:class 3 adenylate cyclase